MKLKIAIIALCITLFAYPALCESCGGCCGGCCKSVASQETHEGKAFIVPEELRDLVKYTSANEAKEVFTSYFPDAQILCFEDEDCTKLRVENVEIDGHAVDNIFLYLCNKEEERGLNELNIELLSGKSKDENYPEYISTIDYYTSLYGETGNAYTPESFPIKNDEPCWYDAEEGISLMLWYIEFDNEKEWSNTFAINISNSNLLVAPELR